MTTLRNRLKTELINGSDVSTITKPLRAYKAGNRVIDSGMVEHK